MSYFDSLPIELVMIIMNHLNLKDKEHFTKAYTCFYHLFEDTKRRFLEENYQVNYRPLVKYGIDKFVEENKLCVRAIMRKKRFYIDTFPEPFRTFFIDYKTPIISYKCDFRRNGIIHCDPEDVKYDVCIGKYPTDKRFIFIKNREKTKVLSFWEREIYGSWDCFFGEVIHAALAPYYVNFKLLENIKELM